MKRNRTNQYSKPTTLTALLLVLLLLISGCADPSAMAGENVTTSAEATTEVETTTEAAPATTTEPTFLAVPADGTPFEELSEEFKAEILQAWRKMTGLDESYGLGWANDGSGAHHYYGICEGFVIIFHRSIVNAEEVKIIGNTLFWESRWFSLMVYRNGELEGLEEAYSNGLVSDAALSFVLEQHEKMLKERFGENFEKLDAFMREEYASKMNGN